MTLVHNSDWTDVFPILKFDVSHVAGADTLNKYNLTVSDSASGSVLTLAGNFGSPASVNYQRNGAEQVTKKFRMTALILDENWLKTKATGIYTLRAIITAVRAAYSEADTVWLPLLIVRDPAGAVARGWHVAGLQRLHVATGGRRIITEPGGSAFVFSCDTVAGSCTSPLGDYTRLSLTGSGGSTIYTRRYSDSTRVWFSATGRMDSIGTTWGAKRRFVYDSLGRPTRLLDPYRTISGGGGNAYTELVYFGVDSIHVRPPQADGTPNDAARRTRIRLKDSTMRAMVDPDGDSTRYTYTTSGYNISGRRTLSHPRFRGHLTHPRFGVEVHHDKTRTGQSQGATRTPRV